MDAATVLLRLTALGVSVTQRPNGNLYLAPASMIPPDLLEAVKQHKPTIIARLRYRQKYQGDGPPGDAELCEIEDRVYSNGYVLLWSHALQDSIAFYADESDKAQIPPGFTPYSLAELERLFGSESTMSADGLRLIHQAKKLGGHVVKCEDEPCR
ncbi:MAG: hypothetical protein Q8P22_01405 [Chloroflexota bacterium]|nr:hypothetical protein [Chloroflexota bacterium]